MDSDQGKLFIGGISWDTSEAELKEYFGNYGDVLQTVVMRDKTTGNPRGFGFVVFADPSVLDRVLQDKHVIDGRTVEAKRALSREEQQVNKTTNPNLTRNAGYGGNNNTRTKKIFVGGLPPSLTEDEFRQYFENFGYVTDVVVMYDQSTQRPRGFGFVSFDTEEAVDNVLHKTFHDLNGKQVEVKRALPKDGNSGGGGGRSFGGGGNYQSYGASGGNIDTYMQPQNVGGGFPGYGSSMYGTPGYGYGGATNNGMSYGGFGGFGGPAAVAYGNPNPQSQSPSGVAAAGYGNQGFGFGGGYGGYGAVGGQNGNAPNGSYGDANSGYGNAYGGQAGGYGGGYGGTAQTRQSQQ